MDGTLLILDGVGKGRKFVLPAGRRTSIGRGPDNEIQIPGEQVSRFHCEITSKGGKFYLKDHSSNGTFVNGSRIKEHVLNNNDIIRVGQIKFRFSSGQAPGKTMSSFKFVEHVAPAAVTRVMSSRDLERTILLDPATVPDDPSSYQDVHKNLATIYQVGNLINSIEDPEELLNTLLETIVEVVSPEHAVILLKDPESGEIEAAASYVQGGIGDEGLVISQTIVQECITKGHHIFCPDAMMDERFKSGESILVHNIRSVICIPLESQRQVLGAIYVDSSREAGAFKERELELLAAIGQQAGISIERANLIRELEELAVWSVLTLVTAIEAKDEYTRGHSERVAAFSVQIAEEMGLGDRMLESIRLGALLHDVGKIGVPETALKKPGRLSQVEYESIKDHPAGGAYIIGQIQNPRMRLPIQIARHHHERWDGKGYPDGLKGEAIPLPARIVAVADSFDAMSTDRPYRKAHPKEVIAEQFVKGAGSQFDPSVCRAFLKIWQEGRLRRPRTLQLDLDEKSASAG